MKKIISLAVLVLALSGCGAPKDDINNEQNVADLYYDYYVEQLQNDTTTDHNILEKERVVPSLTFQYTQLDDDKENELICYSDGVNGTPLGAVMFLDVKNGKYNIIENDMPIQGMYYSQKITTTKDKILRTISQGGTDVVVTTQEIYAYDGNKIVNTNVTLDIDSKTNFQENTYTGVSKITGDDNFDEFAYVYSVTDQNGNVTKSLDENYKYNKDTYSYDKTVNVDFSTITPEAVGNPAEYEYPKKELTEEEFKKEYGDKMGYTEYLEGNIRRFLSDLQPETIGDVKVDYTNKLLVIIPMQESVNRNITQEVKVDLGEDKQDEVFFSVFGELKNVTLSKGIKSYGIGDLQNTTVTVIGNMDEDLTVNGVLDLGEGEVEQIEFKIGKDIDPTTQIIIK